MPDKKEHKCSGTWCHACSSDKCCEEQKEWDKLIEQEKLEQINQTQKEANNG